MKKLRKPMIVLLMLILVSGSLWSAGTKEATSSGKQKVDFWYLWGGDEAKLIEEIIAEYNKSQDRYEVVGLSAPDQQKIITAISGGQGPDVTDDFGSSIPKYAAEEIAMPLDDLIERDKLDISTMAASAVENQMFEGKIYGLPISINVYALFYNKDLLAASGVSKLPETLEELMALSDTLTKKSGENITQMGGPFVPAIYYWPYSFTYAHGTYFGSNDGSTLTPDNSGFRSILEFTARQVAKWGKDSFNNYVTSGASAVYTPQDPFLQGTQVFRMDGPWFYNMAQDAGINFGVMPLPGTKAMGGDGYSLLDTSNVYIPTTAKNKEGAWDFVKYMTVGEGAKHFVVKKGDLPALLKLTSDPEVISAAPSNEVFLSVVAKNNYYSLPQFSETALYQKHIQDAITDVMLGTSVDKALSDLVTKSRSLVK